MLCTLLCRCQAGYYGDPILGSGDHCRPCPCPDGPESGRQFASGCYQDPITLQVVCVCSVGYIGIWWEYGGVAGWAEPLRERVCSYGLDVTTAPVSVGC